MAEEQQDENFWGIFCGTSRGVIDLSCIDHALPIGLDFLLLFGFLAFLLTKPSSKSRAFYISPLQLISAIFNGSIGLLYIGVGIWVVIHLWGRSHRVLPLHTWIFLLFHGVTWLTLSVTVSLGARFLPWLPFIVLSVLGVVFAAINCGFSIVTSLIHNHISNKAILDISSLFGSCLLVICFYRASNYGDDDDDDDYAPLSSEGDEKEKIEYVHTVTPFSRAGFFGKLTFSWLSELLKRGKTKTLDQNDVPQLRTEDRAESCYLLFLEHFNKQVKGDAGVQKQQPSLLKTIALCHWKEILISGVFALLKICTLSAGPLLLNAFIKVAEGKASFKYEGYVLAALLFSSKTIESCSQRQWFFRSRLIGLKVRSLLSAAIYKKQLRLSNAAKMKNPSGEIMNYVTVDAYRIGEFPFWFHQTWTTSLQLCFAIAILYSAVGIATLASLIVIVLTVLSNTPLAKLQHKYQSMLVISQDERLKSISEALVNMKVLKLYAWENHFKDVIEKLRAVEEKWLSAVLFKRSYGVFVFWSSPVLVSTATFGTCYFLGIPLYASNVFTFIATIRLVQDPVRSIPDVIGIFILAKVSYQRIVNFLEAPELDITSVRRKQEDLKEASCYSICIKSASLSWEGNPSKANLRDIDLEVRPGEKVAICGEVGSGKSTLLDAILGEVPIIQGDVQTHGRLAYVSQSAWIQTGSIRDNVLFGLPMDQSRYNETLEKSLLVKDLELFSYGDLTEIGERGVNLSGGQKQRIQLARALYQNADVYLLDDPFSAVDAETAASLFNEYVMEALSGKTVLLVTHQVDFLPAFDNVLFMSNGEILNAAPYHQLLASSKEFQNLVNAHKTTAGSENLPEVSFSPRNEPSSREIQKIYAEQKPKSSGTDQLIKQEQREIGDSGFKPYIQYLSLNKGFFFFFISVISLIVFVIGQTLQNSWMATNVGHHHVSQLKLIVVYLLIGFTSTFFLFIRSLSSVILGLQSSKSLFKQLLDSLFRAPMAFYNSTPSGRILSRVSADLNIVDLDLPFILDLAAGSTIIFYSNLGVLAVITWEVLFVSLPLVYLAIHLQRYYFASAKELMRINGTSKSLLANHLAESLAGAMSIRAFEEEDRFFKKNLELIDNNASPFFHNFAANEWFIGRLEMLSAIVLTSSTLCMVLLPHGTFTSGVIGMALSYGLSLNMSLVFSFQQQCSLANYIISVERLNQYMCIPSEAPEIIESCRPPVNWPSVGKVDIQNLQMKYSVDGPLVLRGISCVFEGGDKIGIVGRTGSGKSTLIGALFRLVEASGGRIMVDEIDISTIGLHDLRSRLGVIPQDPTLFNGTVRFNLDPLGHHTDNEIWEVLKKCQLREAVEKGDGLNSWVVEDGSNWSMGQRQLFCLGRVLLRKSKILVLDEATASIDNATDMTIQKIIRTEFADCTVITVAHRIPTVMDCTKVLAISDGKLVEYDEPMKLMKKEGSLFGQLVQEYWSHNPSLQDGLTATSAGM